MKVGPEAARTGKQGVVCRGVKRGGPHQTLDITPGRYGAVALVRVPTDSEAKATMTVSMTPLDEQGNNLPSLSTTVTAAACGWTRIATAGDIPAVIGKRRVKKVRLIVIVDGFGTKDEVHIDDVALFRVE